MGRRGKCIGDAMRLGSVGNRSFQAVAVVSKDSLYLFRANRALISQIV